MMTEKTISPQQGDGIRLVIFRSKNDVIMHAQVC